MSKVEVGGASFQENKRDGITRPAVVLDNNVSMDVLLPDGKLLCTLNLFYFGQGKGDVDVILSPAQQGTFLAWNKGGEAIRMQTPEGTTVHAVDIGERPHACLP